MLLIDEIDKTDQEFEAMLLEVLSDFQISIPELGRVESRSHPVVLLTSNNSRELTEALKRRCLYLWLDYPSLEHELEIVRLHAPELPEAVARRLVELIGMVRDLDLKKPPSIAESIDWARALLLLGVDDIDAAIFAETMSVIVKHRTDIDVVTERIGLKLGSRGPDALAGSLPPGGASGPGGPAVSRLTCPPARPRPAAGWPPGLAARVLEFGEELRAEGVAIGTSELLDAFSVLQQISWTTESDFREALAATLAKSQEDRRIFELVFDRFFFRAVEAAAVREGVREQGGISPEDFGEANLDTLRQQIAAALRDGSEGAMRDLARLAIAAFGRQGEGSGVIGVDVQRIRRASACAPTPSPTCRRRIPGARACRATRSGALSRCCAASSSAPRSSAPRACLPPVRSTRSTGPCRRGPCRTSPPFTAWWPSSSGGWPPRGSRPAATGAASTWTCGARCAPRWRREASRWSSSIVRAARAARRSTCCATCRPA